MSEIKLTLNNVSQSDTDDAAERINKAAKLKSDATETMDEAWARIFEMKNSYRDIERLHEVRRAMAAGELGREVPAEGKRQGKFNKAEAMRLWKVLAERGKADKLRKMVEDTPDNYELITTESQMVELIDALMDETIVAIDTETTGVDVYTDVIVGMSFTLPVANRHVYIPVDHVDCVQLSIDYVIDAVDPILRNESIGKVFHNAIFDIAMFRRHGSDVKGVAWDTMTAMHLLNENEPSFKLKDLAPLYLGVESDTYAELFGNNAQFKEVPLDIALVYAAKDTEITWKLFEFQRRHMEKMPTILDYYVAVEVPLLTVIVDLEANGYVLDLDFAERYGKELRDKAEMLREELVRTLSPYHTGEGEINLNSSQQMRPAVSKAIGRELPNMDAKKTLNPLKDKHEVIANLIEYKDVTKLSGTYIDALPKKQNPSTRRWHSRFNPMGTVTGRFSSGKVEEDKSGQGFNVQNQPENARRMFVAPEGKVLIGADFKAQEIRCVAYMSGEPVLINAFLEERDPYANMASNFFKRPYVEVYKNDDGSDTDERKQMKVVWLATLYGMSDFSLANTLGVDKKEATEFKEELFGSMPKLNAWLEANKSTVHKQGFVWADHGYRKRRLPEATWRRKKIPYGQYYNDKYKKERIHNAKIGTAFRQATNARVQGSSSIQTKVTMIKAHEYCANKPGWALWGSIHDEILFEVPRDFSKEDAEDIRQLMLESYTWGDVVPNGTDIEVMERWGEGVPVEEWFNQ